MKKLIILILFTGMVTHLFAQTDETSSEEIQQLKKEIELIKSTIDANKPGKSGFLLRGYAHSGLQVTEDAFTFEGGSFNPLFIYKQSDKLMFESELELELNGSEVELGLEYANISYLLTKNITIRVGKFLTPFGIFVPRLHPAWINKFPTAPLGGGHHNGVLPSSDIGLEVRGAAYLGVSKVNYSFYLINGPQLKDGTLDPEEAGRLQYGTFPDNNKNKTIGGRVGVLPFPNSSLEVGFSGMYGKVGDQDSDYEDIAAFLYSIDLSFVKNLTFMSSVIDVRGQYNRVRIDDAAFPLPDDTTGDLFYDFDNQSETYFGQLSIRPALLSNKILRNFEAVGRYSSFRSPEGSKWETDQSRVDLGLNYWINWRTVFKLNYQINNSNVDTDTSAEEGDGHGHGEAAGKNVLIFHWAIGF